jgi:hypothetical protein
MAKKKKNKQQGQQFLSPEKYVKQKARTLEIGPCYVSNDIEQVGEGHVIVSRKHTGGRVSMAVYLIDIWCVGVKDSFYRLRMEDYEFNELVGAYNFGLRECSYDEAHNWVYGAVAFAEEAGIEPNKSFKITQYMLEEDDDNIPLIEYEYGKNGKHTLVAHSRLEASRYLPLLEKNLGKGNFDYILNADDDLDDVLDDVDDDEDSSWLFKGYGPRMPYTYRHPDYPKEIQLNFPWIQEELSKTENAIYLKDELTDRILALPHEALRQDLENLIMYHIGLTCDGIPEGYDDGQYNGLLSSCVILIAEVGNSDSSLDCVFEVMRQSTDFFDYHLGDSSHEVFVPTLYKLAGNRLDKLLEFIKEEGLYWLPKAEVFPTVVQIALRQPERRAEVIEWFRQALHFCIDHVEEAKAVDNEVAGTMICDLIELQAVELLPEINALFDTEMVNIGICGKREEVLDDIVNPDYTVSLDNCILDIHDRFEDMFHKFKRY